MNVSLFSITIYVLSIYVGPSICKPLKPPLSIILTHSEECYVDLTDGEILEQLSSEHSNSNVHNWLRKLNPVDLLWNHFNASDDEAVIVSTAITSAYLRLKKSRELENQRLFNSELTQSKQRELKSDVYEHRKHHTIQPRRLSEETTEGRRDRLLALLEVALNADVITHSQLLNVTPDSTQYKQINPRYLSNLQIDIISIEEHHNRTLLFDIASSLPCLAASPENDSEKIINNAFLNDLRIKGNREFPRMHQWGLLGPDHGEAYGANILKAWTLFSGNQNPGFVIAVVDTGCSMHPDLELILCPSDDPECGGYDFGDDDDNPFDEPLDKVHGTLVTSVLAASPANSFGIAGMCWNCRIMCLKVYNTAERSINKTAVLRAYDFIIGKKVLISNHSYISYGLSHAEYRALSRMREAGHLLVVAAGNQAINIDNKKISQIIHCSYFFCEKIEAYGQATPASVDLDNILTVGSIDQNGRLSYFSNWGLKSVDIMAPGAFIPALLNTMKYGSSVISSVSGTSFACPHVTATAALIWGRKKQLTYKDVKRLIMSTARPLEGLRGLSVTGGIVDAFSALASLSSGSSQSLWIRRVRPQIDNTAVYYGNGRQPARQRRNSSPQCLTKFSIILVLFSLLFSLSV